MLRIVVGSLAGSEIAVHFGCGLENGHTWKRFNNLKNLFDLWLEVYESGVAAPFLYLPARRRKYPEAGAADEFEIGEVENQILDSPGQHGGELPLEFRGRSGVEAAREVYGRAGYDGIATVPLDVYFECHILCHFLC